MEIFHDNLIFIGLALFEVVTRMMLQIAEGVPVRGISFFKTEDIVFESQKSYHREGKRTSRGY